MTTKEIGLDELMAIRPDALRRFVEDGYGDKVKSDTSWIIESLSNCPSWSVFMCPGCHGLLISMTGEYGSDFAWCCKTDLWGNRPQKVNKTEVLAALRMLA